VKKLITALSVVSVVALLICVAPFKTVAYTAVVDYQDTETYYESEPYQDTETYYEDEPYEDIEKYTVIEPYQSIETYNEDTLLQYEINSSYVESVRTEYDAFMSAALQREITKQQHYLTTTIHIKNTDNVVGSFTVKSAIYTITKHNYYLITRSSTFNPTVLDNIFSPNSLTSVYSILANETNESSTLVLQPGETNVAQHEYKVDPDREYYKLGQPSALLSISEMGHFLNRTLWHNQATLTSSLRPWL